MNSDLYFDGKKFISSNRAAKITGYVNDYIGQLCRDGKLECRMVGRSWYVSFESLISHKNANGNGTKSRSQKHIRKVTLLLPELEKNEAFEIASVAPIKSLVDVGVIGQELGSLKVAKPIKISGASSQSDKDIKTEDKDENKVTNELGLPSPFVFDVHEKTLREIAQYREHKKVLTYMFPQAMAGVLSLFVAIAGFLFAVQANPETKLAYNNFFQSVKNTEQQILADVGTTLIASAKVGEQGFVDRAGIVVYQTINGWIFKTQRRILVMAGLEPRTETIVEVDVENARPNQGIVVVPTDEKTDRQAVVAKIKKTFSDEVTVSPSAEGNDGVITPIFKKAKGDDYLYVLVPIKN